MEQIYYNKTAIIHIVGRDAEYYIVDGDFSDLHEENLNSPYDLSLKNRVLELYSILENTNEVPIKELRSELLNPNTALIETWWFESNRDH